MPATPVLWTDSFQVNTTDTGPGGDHQINPSVTQLAYGNILVTWQSDTNSGVGDPSGSDIIGQIFDPAGVPVGGEFRLNICYSVDNETNPSVVALTDGGFMLVHEDNASSTDRSVRMQIFGADGSNQGVQTIAHDTTTGAVPNYFLPVVASVSPVSAIVAYVRDGGGGDQDVVYRIKNPLTGALGAGSLAYDGIAATGGGIDSLSVSALSNDTYVLAFSDADTASLSNVRFQIINAAGDLIGGGDVIVGTSRNDDVSVVGLRDGGFAVTWTSSLLGDFNIRTRVFQNDGTPVTANLPVATTTAGVQNEPSVAALRDGGYLIAWADANTGLVRAQRFDQVGAKVGDEFVAGSAASVSGVTANGLADGRVSIAWTETSGADSDVRMAIFDSRDMGNGFSQGPDVVVGTIGDNAMSGGGGNDRMYGGDGNDVLFGGEGQDLLNGGNGFDNVSFNGAAEGIVLSLDGSIEHFGEASGDQLVSIEGIYGSTHDDRLVGDAGDNRLDGQGGQDTLEGGDGNDTLVALGFGTSLLYGGQGADRFEGADGHVRYDDADYGDLVISMVDPSVGTGAAAGDNFATEVSWLTAGSGNDQVIGNDRNNFIWGAGGKDTMSGGVGNDTLYGEGAKDALTGGIGNDTLTGGAGVDLLTGGEGDDTYVDPTGDTVVEQANGGVDTVESNVTYSLSGISHVENLTLTGAANANAIGNSLANVITGNSADNRINGGAGGDLLIGGAGNDTYINPLGDVIVEMVDAGVDTVESNVTSSLAALENVENLTLTGAANINAAGNTLANVLTGNSGNNILNGSAGADTMAGGAGNDIYYVDTAGDVSTEDLDQGTDLVSSSVSRTLSANIENLNLSGTTNIDGNGNTGANVINGNAGNNILRGYEGSDTLDGREGVDILLGGAASDRLNPGTDGVLDIIRFGSVTDSTGSQRDILTGMDLNGEDAFDFTILPISVASVNTGSLSLASINADLAAALNVALAVNAAVLFDPSAGDLNVAGHKFLVVDANGDGSYSANQDYVVQLVNATGSLTLDDFI